jgi:hypothetical protein
LPAAERETALLQALPDGLGAVYLFDEPRAGKPAVWAFAGASLRPEFRCNYPDEAARARAIQQWTASLRVIRQRRIEAARRAAAAHRASPHTFKVGDVLATTWGYDQTNADFYEVTRVISPLSIELAHLRTILVSDGPQTMTGKAMPQQGDGRFDLEMARMRRRPIDGAVRIDACHGSARLWDGRPISTSSYA